MKTITELKTQVKNKKRVSVYLDGAYYCGLDTATVLKNRLKVGMEIDEKNLIEIQKESELQACFDSALTFISGAIKTEREVYQKLVKKGYLPEICSLAVEKVKSYGYLDDGDYAKRYVSTYAKTKGKRLIGLQLKQKGVSDEQVEQAVLEIENQGETAKIIAEKYLKNKQVDRKILQKCYKYLLSKGFDYDDAKYAISSYDDEDLN